jgi:hypothetical protein
MRRPVLNRSLVNGCLSTISTLLAPEQAHRLHILGDDLIRLLRLAQKKTAALPLRQLDIGVTARLTSSKAVGASAPTKSGVTCVWKKTTEIGSHFLWWILIKSHLLDTDFHQVSVQFLT